RGVAPALAGRGGAPEEGRREDVTPARRMGAPDEMARPAPAPPCAPGRWDRLRNETGPTREFRAGPSKRRLRSVPSQVAPLEPALAASAKRSAGSAPPRSCNNLTPLARRTPQCP